MGSFDPPKSYEKHKRENQNGCNQVNNKIKLTYKHIISVTNNPDRLLQNSIWCWSARFCLELIKCVFLWWMPVQCAARLTVAAAEASFFVCAELYMFSPFSFRLWLAKRMWHSTISFTKNIAIKTCAVD